MRKLFVLIAICVLPIFMTSCQSASVGTSNYRPSKSVVKHVYSRDRRGVTKRAKRKYAVRHKTSKVSRKKTRVKSKSASKRSKRKTSTRSAKRKRSSKRGRGRGRYSSLIAKHARAHGVPVKFAMAVVQVESNYRAGARGAAGEIGLMQLMPRTARYIGYKGKLKRLYNPDTNLRYGMKYLAKAYRLGGGSTCRAILKYNAGHGAKKMNPISRKYCKRVRRIMRKR